MIDLKTRFNNSIYGVVLGDVLGVPFQFYSKEFLPSSLRTDNLDRKALMFSEHKRSFYSSGINFGTFSDDTSLTLATIDAFCSIGHIPDNNDYKTIISRFTDWYEFGAYTQTGFAWDIGNRTEHIMEYYSKYANPILKVDKTDNNSGNGALMRFAPIPFMIKAFDMADYKDFVIKMTTITHATSECVECAMTYTELMLDIINGIDKSELKNKYKISGKIQSSGYVVDTLNASMWAFFTTDNFSDCICEAIKLGNDTDTVGAVAGSIAGAYYNETNEAWKKRIIDSFIVDDYINRFIKVII